MTGAGGEPPRDPPAASARRARRWLRAGTWGLLAAGAAGALALQVDRARRLEARVQALVQRNRALEAELARALEQREQTVRLLAQRVAELGDEGSDESGGLRAGMPEGVRVALSALNDCLRADGHGELRFFHARAIEDGELRGVELVERHPRSLQTTLYLAERVEAVLQRERSQLELRLHGGHALTGGVREAFPEEGLVMRFPEVDGPMWERRCALVLEGHGEYPREPREEREPARVDDRLRQSWLGRLDDLLRRADTDMDLRVHHIGGLGDRAFHDVLLVGYDSGRKLALVAEAARMRVVGRGGTVELVLEEGVLRRAGGHTTIPEHGYSILLPSLRPEEAEELMLGMVERR